MKAIVWTKYGPPEVLQLREVETPTPAENEVRIKVRAATVTAGDCEVRSLKLPILFRLPIRLYAGFIKPQRISILGQELAGEVESIGKEVKRLKEGDAVFAATFFRFGAYAEYACLPESYLHLKPTNMAFEEAATIPTGGVNGLHFLNVANVQPGEKVLINGAGGSIGTYALQIAKSLGAEVTAVDSAEKLTMLRSIGAGDVVDYTSEDFTKRGKMYDVIIDIAGKSPSSASLRSLKPNGRYILGNAGLPAMIKSRFTPRISGKKVMVALASYQPEDYARLKELIEAGTIKPVIDRRFPLEQTAEAHRYVEAGHKKGHVIITMEDSS